MEKEKEVRIFSLKNPLGKKGIIPSEAFELSRHHGKRNQGLPEKTRQALRTMQRRSGDIAEQFKKSDTIIVTRKRFGGYRIPAI